MKIAKAAVGVIGVAMALGAAAPAMAAADPLAGATQLLGPDAPAPGKGSVKTPLKDVDVNGLVGTVDKTAKTLKTEKVTGATTQLGGAS
ncbi:hypothetical protein [Streptomyces sp. G45]|uniref:hypothetical protein n=1 Tax=Streptomyces sp. G45 TaxID=3406627 RepID=UPI003C162CEC